jgi:hypothetical protein
MKHEFPQYRKLINEKSYYRIDSADSLTEVQRTGERYTMHELRVKILPERILIADLLEAESSNYMKIAEVEYNDFLYYCENNLRRY